MSIKTLIVLVVSLLFTFWCTGQQITTIAGTGAFGYTGDNGAATSATFNTPYALTVDTNGNVYLSDRDNYRIRRIDTGSIITTVAGTGMPGFSGDGGAASTTNIAHVPGICMNRLGDVLFTDMGNRRIRVLIAGSVVSIGGNGAAGSTGDGGAATSAAITAPFGIVSHRSGNILFSDPANNIIRSIGPTGIVSRFAGTGSGGFSGDGGPATAATFAQPSGLATDTAGNIYVADYGNSIIRKIDLAGTITTIAGMPGINGYTGDGGLAMAARIEGCRFIAIGRNGQIYLSQAGSHRIRMVDSNGVIVTVAGTGIPGYNGDTLALSATRLFAPQGLATYKGMLYISDSGNSRIRRIDSCTSANMPVAGLLTGPAGACIGVPFLLSSSASSGNATVWVSSDTTIAKVAANGQVNPVGNGTVTIRYIVSNNCGSAIALHTVAVAAPPAAAVVTGLNGICAGGTGNMRASVSGGIWRSNAANITIDSLTGFVVTLDTGRAIVTYTLSNACGQAVTADTFNVAPFPRLSSALNGGTVCSRSGFNYVAAAAAGTTSLRWYRPVVAGILNASDTGAGNIAETLVNTTNGPLTVTYYYTLRTAYCTNIETVTVTVLPLPHLLDTATRTTCSGQRFDWAPGSYLAGTTYAWVRNPVAGITPGTGTGYGAISEVLNNTSAGPLAVTYVFTLSASGCTDTSKLRVIVGHQAATRPAITTHPPFWVCTGTMFQNFGTATPPTGTTRYSWSATGANIYATGRTGQYCLVNFPAVGTAHIYLSATDSSSTCPSRDTFRVYAEAADDDQPGVAYLNGAFVSLRYDQYSYQWGYDDAISLDSTLLEGETNQDYYNANPAWSAKYYWVITTNKWCMRKDYFVAPLINIATQTAKPLVTIYPNPAAGHFYIDFKDGNNSNCSVAITDIAGREVHNEVVTAAGKQHFSTNLPDGLYFVRISGSGYNFIKPLVISK